MKYVLSNMKKILNVSKDKYSCKCKRVTGIENKGAICRICKCTVNKNTEEKEN